MGLFGHFISIPFIALLAFAGCSSRDKDVENIPKYRDVSAECQGLELSGERLGPAQARSLVGCLNSSGALAPLAALLNRATDAELAGLMRWSSVEFIENKQRLNQIDQTMQAMRSTGELKPALAVWGELLADQSLVDGVLGSLRSAFRDPAERALILRALEILSARLAPDQVMRSWDEISMLAGTQAAQSFRSRLKGMAEDRALSERYGSALHALLKSARAGESRTGSDPLEAVLREVIDGRALPLWDEWVGRDPESIATRVPELSSMLSVVAADGARLGDSLFRFMQGVRGEVQCLGGTYITPDGAVHVLREVATRKNPDFKSFVLRDARLDHAIQASFCEFPLALERHYGALAELASSSAAETFDRLTKLAVALKKEQLLADLLSSGLKEGGGGLIHLLPLMADWERRDLAPDAILFLQSLSESSRKHFLESFSLYHAPDARLGGKSVFGVLADALTRADTREVAKVFSGLMRLMDPEHTLKDGMLLTERLKGAMEKGFTATDAHPFMQAIQSTAAKATANADLFESLVEISRYPEFGQAITFLGSMARDGSLEELTFSVLKLFKSMSDEGYERALRPKVRVHASPLTFRHELSARDLIRKPVSRGAVSDSDPCAGIRFSIPLNAYRDPAYGTQIEALLRCAGVKPELEPTIALLRELRAAPTAGGHTIWTSTMNLVTDLLRFTPATTQALVAKLFTAYDDRRLMRAIDAIPFLTEPVTALTPAISMIFEKARSHVRVLLRFASDVITLPDAPKALSFVRGLEPKSNLPDPLLPNIENDTAFRAQVRAAVRAHECVSDSVSLELRTQQVFDEYREAANNWELVGGSPRRRWEFSELKERLTPLVEKAAHPERDGPVIEGLLRFFRFFSLSPQGVPYEERISATPSRREAGAHYHPEYLARWLSERTHDPKLILYFYPDTSLPRVRIVNTLDRLEALLYNADFGEAFNAVTFRQENIGLMSLARIGEAWGDEPRSMWPEEIKRMKGNRALTLSQAYDGILDVLRQSENLLKYPPYRDCPGEAPVIPVPRTGSEWIPGPIQVPFPMDWRRRIFNLRQVITVMSEELPGRGEGMRLLRDLFFTLHMTTPESARSPKAGRRNNLVVIGDLVKTGMIRQISRRLMTMPEIPGELARWNDPAYRARAGAMIDFFVGFAQAAHTSHARKILEHLLIEDPENKVLWNSMEAIFRVSEQHPNQVPELRELALYALASGKQLGLVPSAARALSELITAERGLLARSPDRLVDLLQDPKELPGTLRAIYEAPMTEGKRAAAAVTYYALERPGVPTALVRTLEAIDGDPRGRASWDEFERKWDLLKANPAYVSLGVSQLMDDALDVFVELPELRQNLARGVASGDFEALLEALARDPERLERVLERLSFHAARGDFLEPLAQARKSLVPNPKLRDNRSHGNR